MNSHLNSAAESGDLTGSVKMIDSELMEVIAKFFSHMVGVRSGSRGDQITNLKNALVLYGSHGVSDGHGGVIDVPFPDLPQRFPAGDTTLRALGTNPDELRRTWERRLLDKGTGAALDVDVLTVLFPLPLWRIVALLLRDGPATAVERFERGFAAKALEPKRASERRQGDRLSRSYVAKYHAKAGQIFSTLSEMRKRGIATGMLDAWALVPRLAMPDVPRLEMDVSGPPLRKVRLYRASLNEKIERTLRLEAHDGEVAAVRAMSPSKLNSCALWRPIRDRLIVDLFSVVGLRIGAMIRLRRSDYRPRHQSPDGRIGPALALRPAKTMHPDEVLIKPIPAGLAAEIETYLVMLERLVTVGSKDRPARQMPSEHPLLVLRPSSVDKEIQQSSIRQRFGGVRPGPKTLPIRPQILRFDDAEPDERRSFVGYSPHTFRHTAEQLTREATRILNLRHGEHYSEQVYTAALQDREMYCDPYGYGDLDNPRNREVFAGRAAEVNWELVATDAGLRRRVDLGRFEANLRLLRATGAEIERLRGEADRVFAETRRRKGTTHQKLDAILSTQESFHRIQELNDKRLEIRVRLNELRNDEPSFAFVPDEDPDPPELDLDAVEKRILGGAQVRAAERVWRRPVRFFLTLPEFAEVFGIPYPSAHRYVNGRLPFPAGDPRNPWEADAIPFDRSIGKRKGRIPITGIKPGFLRTEAQRDRLLEVLASGRRTGGDPTGRPRSAWSLASSPRLRRPACWSVSDSGRTKHRRRSSRRGVMSMHERGDVLGYRCHRCGAGTIHTVGMSGRATRGLLCPVCLERSLKTTCVTASIRLLQLRSLLEKAAKKGDRARIRAEISRLAEEILDAAAFEMEADS